MQGHSFDKKMRQCHEEVMIYIYFLSIEKNYSMIYYKIMSYINNSLLLIYSDISYKNYFYFVSECLL